MKKKEKNVYSIHINQLRNGGFCENYEKGIPADLEQENQKIVDTTFVVVTVYITGKDVTYFTFFCTSGHIINAN